ncbi:MAG: glycosyltransferase [Firmicutes bacterium]|nr:glycosyltransferase [Bacillota bacterium]
MAGKRVQFLGYQDDSAVADLMERARAVIFAAEEDFGIVPVEAQACGTPVIAYGRGGAVETVIPADGRNWSVATGVHFAEQSVESLSSAIRQFLGWEGNFQPAVLRRNAERFSKERFKREIANFVQEKWLEFREKRDSGRIIG